jgi:hypothetical protein
MMGDEGSKGVVWVGLGRESRRRRVAPRLNDQIVLSVNAYADRRTRSILRRWMSGMRCKDGTDDMGGRCKTHSLTR